MQNIIRKRPFLTVIIGLLLLAAIAYYAKGLYILVVKTPVDLHQRWVEQQYVFNRQDPYDVYFANVEPFASAHKPSGRNEHIDSRLGLGFSPGYPPWELFAGYVLYWPRWELAKPYFAGLNLLACSVLIALAFNRGKRAGDNFAGLLLAASVAAIASICTTLGNGQLGILVMALLAGFIMLEECNWHLLAGILAGVAAIKPNIGGPFLCVLIVRRRWPGFCGALGFIVVGSLFIWYVTGANPTEMLQQMLRGAETFLGDAYGPPNLLAAAGIPLPTATTITALIGVIAALTLTIRYRRIPLLPLFGMISVIARFWAYHKTYDNITVVFLLVALGELMVSRRKNRIVSTVFWAVGISLWLPAKYTDYWPFQIFEMLIWIVGLVVLCVAWQEPAKLDPEQAGQWLSPLQPHPADVQNAQG